MANRQKGEHVVSYFPFAVTILPFWVILGDGVPASVSSLPGQGLPAIILDAGLWQQNAKENYSLEEQQWCPIFLHIEESQEGSWWCYPKIG